MQGNDPPWAGMEHWQNCAQIWELLLREERAPALKILLKVGCTFMLTSTALESQRWACCFPELQEKMSKEEPPTASIKQDSFHHSPAWGELLRSRIHQKQSNKFPLNQHFLMENSEYSVILSCPEKLQHLKLLHWKYKLPFLHSMSTKCSQLLPFWIYYHSKYMILLWPIGAE